MISPAGFAIAAITVMLWLVWSDTLRARRTTPIVASIRVLLFLGMSGVLVFNMIHYPWQYRGGTRGLVIFAAAVGVAGAAYFARKLVARSS